MKNKSSVAKRLVALTVIGCLLVEPAVAAVTDIANVPLASSAGSPVLPNLLFTLDNSGSMGWDYLPDYVNDPNTCMRTSGGGTTCSAGDPSSYAGGANGFNGVAYDPRVNYQPGLNSNGTPVLTSTLATPANPYTLDTASLTPDAYLGGTAVNLTTGGATDKRFCNANSVCKRNGQNDSTGNLVSGTDGLAHTMSAGEFPYRSHPSNSSSQVFGLPEMMPAGVFSRSSSTVTVATVEAHGLAVSDWIFVTGTGSVDVTAVQVATVPNANSFTYTSGSGTVGATNGFYRKHSTGTFVRVLSTVTATATAHGLAVNDVVTVNSSTSALNVTSATVTAVTANTFTYTAGSSGAIAATAGTWVRNGLYNSASTTSSTPISYFITPVEYCSDAHLTNCVEVIPPAAPPAAFPFPAYVRFCQTQAQAIAPGAVADSSGTVRCRGRYVNSAGLPQYIFPRYGWFNRDTIKSTVATYGNRTGRTDCAAAPSCTYTEEIQNYARWYTFYRTRMQMMKTASGRAFVPFVGNPTGTPRRPNSIRTGFITIHAQDSGTVAASQYLKISDFNTTQASSFYTKFYSQVPNNATPLQEALSRAGWIFAGKLNTGLTAGIPTADDPIQASCQRNFTLLTTDGYWNGNLGKDLSSGLVGNQDNQDNQIIAPYTSFTVDRRTTGTLDGVGTQVTTITPTSTQVEQIVCQAGNNTAYSTGTQTPCGCAAGEHRIKQRTILTGTSVVTVDDVTSSSTPGTTTTFTNVTGCSPAVVVTTTTPKIRVEEHQCKRGGTNPATFSDGSTKSCSSCSNSKGWVVRQSKDQTQTDITTDGIPTSSNTATNSTTYSYTVDGSSYVSSAPSGGSCVSSVPTAQATTTTPGTSTASSNGGSALTITFSPNPTNTVGGAPTSTTVNGGSSDTLADVALYYYKTDLRSSTTGPVTSPNSIPTAGSDVSTNNLSVKPGAKDFAKHQHMVTFTVGLADGLMRYQPDYDTATTGDFADIKNGATSCFWTPGTCNWPTPSADAPAALDDLWHAAVNGRGQFYQALNAASLAQGLQNALTALSTLVAAAAAAAVSSPNITQFDNLKFSTTYETTTWSGKMFVQTLDPVTAVTSPTHEWDADALLLSRVGASSDTRTIYTFDATNASTKTKTFTWGALNATEQAYFANKCTPLSTMSQCATLSSSLLTIANDGSRMVGFLRGQQQDEVTTFRDRIVIDPITNAAQNTVLGDLVDSTPQYVRNPRFSYGDVVTPTYLSFATANANRAPRVYVGANDGFLHAFDATDSTSGTGGTEVWAYAPKFLLPNLFALADQNYSTQHQFYVDGTPEQADVFDTTASAWKTILVGGAGGGGAGFYALDITDPNTPKALWEFCNNAALCAISDADLGLAYGNPVIGKRKSDGKWVVVLTSGLNNTGGSNPGQGFFYVLDAITGAVLNKIGTGAGSAGTPSGLMKVRGVFDSSLTDATFNYVYAGDQLGNIWRLELGNPPTTPSAASIPTGCTTAPCVMHFATLKDGAGRAQPITTRPELTRIGTNYVLYVGTGRYLGITDLTDPGAASGIAWQQSVYALKDKNADYGTNVRTGATLVTQTLSVAANGTDRTITANPVDWNTKDGWMVDFNPGNVSPGERVNIEFSLSQGTLHVTTNIPNSATAGICDVGGSHIPYNFDFRTGSAIATAPGGIVGTQSSGTAVGSTLVQTTDGTIHSDTTLVQGSENDTVPTNASPAGTKRFSYRER